MKIHTTLIVIATLCLGIFLFQKSQVKELDQQENQLQQQLQAKASSTSPKAALPTAESSGQDQEKREFCEKLRTKMYERLEFGLRHMKSKPEEPVYANKEYIARGTEIEADFSGLTAQDFLQVIRPEPFNVGVGEDKVNLRPQLINHAARMLSHQNPREGVLFYNEFAEEFKDSEVFSQWPDGAFRKWSLNSPQEAYAWYVEEIAAGNRNLESFREQASLAKAFEDPAGELERLLKLEDPQELADAFTPMINFHLKRADLASHQRLLSALKLTQKKQPNFEPLKDFWMYYHGLEGLLVSELFETATQFMAKNFTPGEMNNFSRNLHDHEISEPAKWASWVMENGDKEAYERFLLSWGKKDPEAVEAEWLGTQPEGPLRTTLSKNHHNQLAGKPSPFAKSDSIKPSVTKENKPTGSAGPTLGTRAPHQPRIFRPTSKSSSHGHRELRRTHSHSPVKTKITLILLGAIAVAIFRSQGDQLEKLVQEQRDLKHSLAGKASSSNPSEGIRSKVTFTSKA